MSKIESSWLGNLLNDPNKIWDASFNGINDSVLLLDPYGIILRANKISYSFFGKKEGEMIGRHCYKVIHNSSQPIEGCPLINMKLSGKREKLIFQDNNKWFEITVDPIFDENKKISGAIHITTDITKRKEIQDALKNNERLLRESQSVAQVGSYEWDIITGKWKSSETLDEIFGIGKNYVRSFAGWTNLVHPEWRTTMADYLANEVLGKYKPFDKEYKITRQNNGKERWVHGRGNLSFDANHQPVKLVGIISDITERKKAELKLQLNEQKLQSIFQAIPAPTYIWKAMDGDFLLTEFNEAARASTFGRITDYVGKIASKMYSDLPEIPQDFAKCLSEKISFEREHNYKFRITNEYRLLNVKYSFVPPDMVMVQTEDITEHKQKEAINKARLRLILYADSHSADELLEETLNELEKLTNSSIGFFHFVDNDQNALTLMNWSTRTKKDFCKAAGKGSHYEIAKAGVWVDCVRERKPVIHNDYKSLPHKKGMPAGHAEVTRELVVPVFRNEKIKAVLGIGNKPDDYMDKDVDTVSKFADLVWDIIDRKKAEEVMKESSEKYSSVFDLAPYGIGISTIENATFIDVNPAYCEMTGYTREELIDASGIKLGLWVDLHERDTLLTELQKSKTVNGLECRFRKKNGEIITALVSTNLFHIEGKPHLYFTLKDITDKKKFEEADKKKNDLITEVQRIGKVGGWELDLGTKELIWTEETCRIHEVDIHYKPLFDEAVNFYSIESRPMIKQAVKRCIEHGESYELDLEIITAKGNVKWVRTIGKRDLDNRRIFGFFQDISSLKNVEKELFKIFNLSTDLICVIKDDGKFEKLNPAWEKTLGYTNDEIKKMGLVSLLHPDDLNPTLEIVRKSKNVFENITFINRCKCKNGSYKTLEWNAAPPANGMLYANARDVTERNQKERSLKESEDKYRNLFLNNPLPMWMVSVPSYNIIDVNNAAIVHYGYSREEFLRMNSRDLRPQEERERFEKQVARAENRAGTQQMGEWKHRKKNGDIIIVEISSHVLQLGPEQVRLVLANDITSRKKTEEKLIAAEEIYRIVFEGATEGIHAADIESKKTVFSNKAFNTMFGYTKEEMRQLTIFNLHPKALASNLVTEFESMAQGKKSHVNNFPCLKKDGTVFFADISSSHTFIDGRKINVGFFTNVTERKQAEEELITANKNLEQGEAVSKIGYWKLNLNTQKFTISNGAKKIYGVDQTTISRDEITKLRLPEYNSVMEKAFEALITEGKEYDIEYKIRRKNDEKKIDLHTKAAYNPVTKIAFGTIQDITEQKKAEEKLKASENRFQRLFSEMIDGFSINEIIFDDTGHAVDYKIIDVNPAFEKLVGVPREAVTGKKASMFMSEEELNQWLLLFAPVALKGESTSYIMNSPGTQKCFKGTAFCPEKGLFAVTFFDFTEAKKAEDALKASEEIFRTVVQSSLNLTILTDEKNQLVFASPQCKNVLGFAGDEFIGKYMPMNIHPEDKKTCLQKWGLLQKEGMEIKHHEYRLVDTDKQIRWISHSATQVRIDGKIKYYQSSIRNISDRKKLEERKEINIQIKDTLNKILNVSTRNIPFDQALKEILNYTLSTKFLHLQQKGGILLTEKESNVLHLKYSLNLPEALQSHCAKVPFGHCLCGRAASTGKIVFSPCLGETHENRYNGIKEHGHYNVPIVSEGKVLGVIVVYLDAGHKQDETEVDFLISVADILSGLIIRNDVFEKLHESEKKFRSFIDKSQLAIYFFNADTKKIIFANPAFFQMLGYAPEDLDSLSMYDLVNHPKENINTVIDGVIKGEINIIGEREWKNKKGKIINMFIYSSYVSSFDEKIIYVTGRDITKLKQTELEREQLIKELSNKYNELMQFNYIVSHNLRSPVANILGLSNLFTMPGRTETEKIKIIEHMQQSANKMDSLIKDLNNILSSRSLINIKKEKVQIKPLLKSIMHSLEKQILESRVQFRIHINDNASGLFTVKTYLESIFYNLINNAIKYRAKERKPIIDINTKKIDNVLQITISDNGIGIDMKKHGQYLFGLYKRFYLEVEGKGLGLHMVKTQIETLGGAISVESEINKGTSFTITFPPESFVN